MNFYNYHYYEKNFQLFYKDLLSNFAKYLNYYHKKKYSINQWQILIGPWLHLMLQL